MTNAADLHEQRNVIERVVLAARVRLEQKLHELGRRVEETKEALDLARLIRERPLAFLGAALAAGATIGAVSGRPQGRLTSALEAMVTGLAVQTARSWLTRRIGAVLDDPAP